MLRSLPSTLVFILTCGAALAQPAAPEQRAPAGAFATVQYRNLFARKPATAEPRLALSEPKRAQAPSAQEERVAASFVLARGRQPTAAEIEAWGSERAVPIADLLARHRRELAADRAAAREVVVKAWRDAFGTAAREDEIKEQTGGDTYSALVQRYVASLAARAADYEQVLQRAYQLRLRREADAIEIDYWKRQPALPFALLVACVDDWARRNRPGLMATAGVASVSVNSDYLETVRLSPAVAMEARAAVGLASATVSDHLGEAALPLAAGRNVIAPGGAHLVSVGGVHFAAAGR